MQHEANISEDKLIEIVDTIFSQGSPIVYEASSEPGQELKKFDSPLKLEAELALRFPSERKFVSYSIHYPESKGIVRTTRLALDPEMNDGNRFRFESHGWGLILLQLKHQETFVTCRVAVNSEKRAHAWFSTYPDHGAPDFWNWKLVEKYARRIIRVLKSP